MNKEETNYQNIAIEVTDRFGYIQNETNTELNVRFWIRKNFTVITDDDCIKLASLYVEFLSEKKRRFHESREVKKASIILMEKINDECRAKTGYSLIAHFIHQLNIHKVKYQLPE